MVRILIIEDDRDICHLLRHALERAGYGVAAVHDGESGLAEATRQPPGLILLDLNLPGVDGLDICRKVRETPSLRETPIIMLTARIDEADRVTGLELGADDYVTKPFSVKEIVARVRALLRRTAGNGSPEAGALSAGDLELDPASRRVHVAGREISLTRKEFDLLADLMRQRGRVLSRERLLERVWSYDHPGATRTVDVHVRQLRKKLGEAVARQIETVVGVGYRFRETGD